MDIKVLCLDLFMQYITKPYLDLVKHPYWNFFCENIYIIVNVQNVWTKYSRMNQANFVEDSF